MKHFIIILLLLPAIAARSQSVQLTVISNPKGAPPQLKFAELKSVFMGEKERWRDGTKVNIALLKTSTEIGKAIAGKVFRMSGDEVRKFFALGTFAFKVNSPETFETVAEVQAYVKKNAGAIGIIDQASLPADATVTIIDGKTSF